MPEWVVLEYAAALAGLTLVTVNPSYQARELEYLLRQSRAAGLLLVEECRGKAHCRLLLSTQKCPVHWEAVEFWPLTGSGKIKKFKLRESWIADDG